MADKSTKMVEVIVAPRHAVWENGIDGRPGKMVGPGKKVMVPESELEMHHKNGFIRDPHVKKLTDEQLDAAGVDENNLRKGYGLNIEGEEKMITEDEDTDTKLERLRDAAAKEKSGRRG